MGTLVIKTLMILITLLNLNSLAAKKEYRLSRFAYFFSLQSRIRQTLFIKRALELKLVNAFRILHVSLLLVEGAKDCLF
jgi:hypothetical protein